MPQFWVMMNLKEKLRFSLFAILLIGGAYFYIQAQSIGPVVSSVEVNGEIHAIQATSPISGVASVFSVSVKLTNGRIVTVEVPTNSNLGVGSEVALTQNKHENGRTRYSLNRKTAN